MTVKAMNDTLGREGILLSFLVCGNLPQIGIPAEVPKPRDYKSERTAMAFRARTKMQQIMANLRVTRGLKNSVPQHQISLMSKGIKCLSDISILITIA